MIKVLKTFILSHNQTKVTWSQTFVSNNCLHSTVYFSVYEAKTSDIAVGNMVGITRRRQIDFGLKPF